MISRYKKLILTSVGFVFIVLGCTDSMELEQNETSKHNAEEYTKQAVIIGAVTLSVPVRRFFLVRNGKDACAVQFTEFHREPNSPTPFSLGIDSEYAEYDWYYQTGEHIVDTKTNATFGHDKTYRKPPWGLPIHGFVWLREDAIIRCGPFRLRWDYPTSIGFHTSNDPKRDVGNEIAPTKWRDISEVNYYDPRLKWYRSDERRGRIDIAIDRLW